jgi:hypothetical protein
MTSHSSGRTRPLSIDVHRTKPPLAAKADVIALLIGAPGVFWRSIS